MGGGRGGFLIRCRGYGSQGVGVGLLDWCLDLLLACWCCNVVVGVGLGGGSILRKIPCLLHIVIITKRDCRVLNNGKADTETAIALE